MQVEFITEEVPIGKVWDTYSQTHTVENTRIDPSTHETIYEIHLPYDQELAVLSHDGLKFADTLFKNRGKTTKVKFETTEIEGLDDHKLMLEGETWTTLRELRLGMRCLDKNKLPVPITGISEGEVQDVFDIQVPDGHHYIANGLISHNSTLANQFAINWSDMGEDVTVVPLEMSEREQTARLMANASGIDVRKILFNKMSSGEKEIYWKSFKRFVKTKKKNQGTLRLFKPRYDMSIEEVLASVYPLGSRIIVIDYISLLKGVDGDDAWQKLGAVARYCKVWAETNKAIVVLLCQLSADGVIRYARSIAEHANYAWTFVATQQTIEQEIINIEQLKARNGERFDFTLKATMANMRIRDLELEEKDKINTNVGAESGGKSGKGKPPKGKGKVDDSKKKEKATAPKEYLKDLSDDDEDE